MPNRPRPRHRAAMIDPMRREVWLHRALFAAVAGAILFLRLLPLGAEAGALPGPDLLVCLIFAWVQRRPDYMPALLIAAVMLLDDLLLQRPPGLWAALVVLGAELLRSRIALTRELSFVAEWLFMAALMLGLMLAYRFLLEVSFLPQGNFGFALTQTAASVLCYPVVVWLSHVTLGVHKPGMGEVDDKGRRL